MPIYYDKAHPTQNFYYLNKPIHHYTDKPLYRYTITPIIKKRLAPVKKLTAWH